MPARRIVSLVPSQTELLYDLGLDGEVAGITKFCIHPEDWRHRKTIVGGTKNVNLDVVAGLKPDLVIANKEENTKSDVESLAAKYKTYVTEVATIDDAYAMMTKVSELTGTSSQDLISEIKTSFASLPAFEVKKALYLIWRKPWMTAGSDTFISEMMKMAGFENVITKPRYPTLENFVGVDPEVVLLSSEPYPFKEQHVDEIRKLFPASKVMLVDGEMFSWYGSRMLKSAEYFRILRASSFL